MERPLDRSVLTAAVLAGIAATAWALTATAPEAMDVGPAPFLASWTAMMAAMMPPSAAPLVLLYRRGTTPQSTAALVSGYLYQYTAVGPSDYAGE